MSKCLRRRRRASITAVREIGLAARAKLCSGLANLSTVKGSWIISKRCSKMLLDMEQQHPASVLLSLNMSQFSAGSQQQQTTINPNNNSSNNNNNSSGTTNLQQLHDHSSSSPPHSNNNNGGGGTTMNNSNSQNSGGHFNNYVTLNNNNSQQQNYQNLYNFDTNQYIFSSTGKLRRKGRPGERTRNLQAILTGDPRAA